MNLVAFYFNPRSFSLFLFPITNPRTKPLPIPNLLNSHIPTLPFHSLSLSKTNSLHSLSRPLQPTMSSSAPAILPISNPQPTPTTAASATAVAGSDPPAASPALRAFVTQLSDSLRHGLSQRRPWSELVDRTAFSKPESFSEATLRVRKNFSYFRVNYYAVVSVILAVSLLTNPFSLLLLLGLLASWTFLYLFRPSDQPLVLLGRTFSDFETLSLLAVLTVFVVFLTSVGSVLVSALMLGVAVVCLHGAFRVPEDLFLDEQENSQATGFLSFLRGAAANAAVASAATPVAARV